MIRCVCILQKNKLEYFKVYLVKLSHKESHINEVVKDYTLYMNGFIRNINTNVLWLRSHDNTQRSLKLMHDLYKGQISISDAFNLNDYIRKLSQ